MATFEVGLSPIDGEQPSVISVSQGHHRGTAVRGSVGPFAPARIRSEQLVVGLKAPLSRARRQDGPWMLALPVCRPSPSKARTTSKRPVNWSTIAGTRSRYPAAPEARPDTTEPEAHRVTPIPAYLAQNTWRAYLNSCAHQGFGTACWTVPRPRDNSHRECLLTKTQCGATLGESVTESIL